MCSGDDGKKLDVYLPPAKWYDWYTYQAVTDKGGMNISVDTPVDYLPVSLAMPWLPLSMIIMLFQLHVRGGYIIPMQEPGLTTVESRSKPYSLLVALPSDNTDAFGDIYLDDGETYNTTESVWLYTSSRSYSIVLTFHF